MRSPPPDRLRQPTPELTPQRAETPAVPLGDDEGAHTTKIEGVSPGYVYIHTPLLNARFLKLGAYAKDCKHDKDSIQIC